MNVKMCERQKLTHKQSWYSLFSLIISENEPFHACLIRRIPLIYGFSKGSLFRVFSKIIRLPEMRGIWLGCYPGQKYFDVFLFADKSKSGVMAIQLCWFHEKIVFGEFHKSIVIKNCVIIKTEKCLIITKVSSSNQILQLDKCLTCLF